jgi:hypothetical protein
VPSTVVVGVAAHLVAARRGDDGLVGLARRRARATARQPGSPVSAVGLAVQPVADQSGAT